MTALHNLQPARYAAIVLMQVIWACSGSRSSQECPRPGAESTCVHAGKPPVLEGEADAHPRDAGAGDSALGSGRPILQGELLNARDLGGTPLEPDAAVPFGALYRGPPLALREQGCDELAQLGIHTVIDLRVATEREAKPDAPCALRGARLVLAPLPVPYDVSPSDYIADLNTTESIATAFQALGDDAAYPVYFHCTCGRDRTGVLAAVILSALGASRDAIMQEYLLSLESVGAYPDSLDAVLDELERRGGIDAYLQQAGIPQRDVDDLRAHAISSLR
jgi:protein-tyrosine phosphatase